MKTKLKTVFKKISEVIERNSDTFEESQRILITNTIFNVIYCAEANVTTCEKQKNIFSDLISSKKKPILYWFSIDEKLTNATYIREKYKNFKDLKSNRSSASYKVALDSNSKTLYVGKVKKDFHLRLVTHLGYSKNENTAGMQLFHWYNPEEFGDITLNYIVFNEDMSDLITILEMELARELKPIIGKY
ncbi:hypothetical protein QWY99_08160 [Flavobacterium branchiarum]|uniref:GIY-YIG domain-containing protein n=1 Tax=Flavobacterium branchiarum TaxID=1114870 RepID=A0ABV5FS24_9FLAO|nr:hypothetical protein [Flavobacterium branchiarum]MDN3673023.1 hypothetical protein [Flavobacterium branchiarum]